MELNGACLDMNSTELNWALKSLIANGCDENGMGLVGNIREKGWMIELEKCLYDAPRVDAYIGSCRNRVTIHGGSLVSCENDQAKFVNAVAPKLGVPRSLRAVMMALHREVEA